MNLNSCTANKKFDSKDKTTQKKRNILLDCDKPIVKPSFKMVVAYDSNNGIGKDGCIPWDLPDELKNFHKITGDADLIMGRKTFESIIKRNGKPLKKRLNIIITSDRDYQMKLYDEDFFNCVAINSIEKLLKLCSSGFVIGGSEIYKELLPYTSTIYASWVNGDYNCDKFFPNVSSNIWRITSSLKHLKGFTSVEYERRVSNSSGALDGLNGVAKKIDNFI